MIAGWMGWASRAFTTRKMTSFVSISWFLEPSHGTSFALQFYNFKLACSATRKVVKYSRLGQHKSFTTNEVSLPSMLSTCFNTGMQLCQKMPIISDQASKSGSSTYVSNLLSNLLRQQWAYEIHKTLSIKKLPECCIYCIYSGRYLHGERRENYKKRMAMATMFISKQLSWFRNSKAFNEKRSEWIPGRTWDEPWTILTRLSQAQSAHGLWVISGMSSRLHDFDTIRLVYVGFISSWYHICNIISNSQGCGIPMFIHVQPLNAPSSSSVLLSTSLVVSGCFRYGMVGSCWVYSTKPASQGSKRLVRAK